MQCPKLILLFSGKRKSGKDFICEQLRDKLNGENETTTCTILRISEPLKSLYANEHNLDLVDLMSAGPYKEHYRLAMINWSDRIRENDPGYFCRAACTTTNCSNNKQLLSSTIWIFSDIRRKTDIEWFKDNYGDEIIRTVRVNADVTTRVDRGWVFTKGVDDVKSECDLDDYKEWSVQIFNNNNNEMVAGLDKLVDIVRNL